jgi:thiamine pyrophosphate-dependent acetolactate synthase large subunit-like protein
MGKMSRLEALKLIAAEYADCPLVVTLGTTARELAGAARADNHLYVLDSMGLPPAIGLGLALALEDRPVEKVVVIEGDGSLLMGLSTLATVGLTQPRKLLLIVLDNGTYAATGGQATAAGAVDFPAMAESCGMRGLRATTADELAAALREARTLDAPALLYAPINEINAPMPYLLEDPVLLGAAFQRWLDQAASGPA